jgi:hypothetical protein
LIYYLSFFAFLANLDATSWLFFLGLDGVETGTMQKPKRNSLAGSSKEATTLTARIAYKATANFPASDFGLMSPYPMVVPSN